MQVLLQGLMQTHFLILTRPREAGPQFTGEMR